MRLAGAETDDLFARHVPTYSYEFTDRRAAPLFEYPADIPAGATHGAAPHVHELGPERTGAFDRSGEHLLRFWRALG
jgi:hypothetical protein